MNKQITFSDIYPSPGVDICRILPDAVFVYGRSPYRVAYNFFYGNRRMKISGSQRIFLVAINPVVKKKRTEYTYK
jgi:hypothetical protein